MDLDELYRLLRGAHVQAQGVIDTIRNPLLVLDDDLMVISANPAFYRTFEAHRDATIGSLFYQLGNGQWDIEDLRILLERVIPKSASVFDYEVIAIFPHLGSRTMLVSAQRLIHPDIGRRVLLLTIVDATESRRKHHEKDILVGKLHHRMKNQLSVTRALASQTRTIGRTAEEYRDAFIGRLDALARALDVSGKENKTSLHALVQALLEPYMGKRGAVDISEEPMVHLSSSQAMALAMILHELAANALNTGALSAPDGRVCIDWRISENSSDLPEIVLRWKESGSPEVKPPLAPSFGTRMIQFAAERDLGGSLEHCYVPAGSVVTLTFPQH